VANIKSAIRATLRQHLGIDVHRVVPRPNKESVRLLEKVANQVQELESAIDQSTTRSDAIRQLRSLTLSDFGTLFLSLPNPAYPKVSSLLPGMADDVTQLNWTGNSGLLLLDQSMAFVTSLSHHFTRITGQHLEDKRILDFGCGYGRLLRLAYYFSDEEQVYGVDPWDRSIDLCRKAGLTKNVFMSDYLPLTLPLPESSFDLIYAFSVFTHLSERATKTCLEILRKYIAPNGVLAITVRPIDYWAMADEAVRSLYSPEIQHRMMTAHRQEGFAFVPHPGREPVNGDITYGETSITPEWIEASIRDCKVVRIDRSLSDPIQICIFLQKAP